MELGSEIGPVPSGVPTGVLDRILREWVAEQDTAAKQITAILDAMGKVAERQEKVAAALLDAVQFLATLPAPVVNVDAPQVNVAPPQVNVANPEPVVNVTVSEPPEEPERGTRKRVVRGPDGLITEVIEEPI